MGCHRGEQSRARGKVGVATAGLRRRRRPVGCYGLVNRIMRGRVEGLEGANAVEVEGG
jgi:hypothetical protein